MTGRLPPVPLRARARNGLRQIKAQWRRVFVRPLPRWTEGGPAQVLQGGDVLELRADSVTAIRTALLHPAAPVASVRLTVDRWRAPHPGWSGRLGRVPGLVAHTLRLPRAGTGAAEVTLQVAVPTPAQLLLDAALAVLDPARPLPAASRAEVTAAGGRPGWLRFVAVDGDHAVGRPTPAVQTSTPLAPADLRLTREDVGPYGLCPPDEHILIDPTTANPVGRGPAGPRPIGELSLTPAPDGGVRWSVHARSGRATIVVAAGRAGHPLAEAHRTALGRLGAAVDLAHADGVPAAAHASVLAQLAATGLVLGAEDLPPATAALLEPDLARAIAEPLPAPRADPMLWEQRGVVQRRAALRGHGVAELPITGPLAARQALPTVSVLLVTRRPNYLPRVLRDLAAQTYPQLELVLGLHGVALDASTRTTLADLPFPVEVLELSAELRLGEALAAATRAARGALVTKVDDDDRYGREHVWDLVLARLYSGATLVGRAAEFVHLSSYDATVRRRWASEAYTDLVAGATMLISRGDLEALGGWRPVARAVDRALLDRVISAGGLIYCTHAFGFIISRHGDGHTWDPGSRYFLTSPARRWLGYPPYAEFALPA